MRFGVFCTYENPQQDYRALLRDADAARAPCGGARLRGGLGRRASFRARTPSAPPFSRFSSYLAGVTTTIRLGSAAVLLAFRNPIQVAEDVATIDLLSKGRFDFGVARGGPFELQNRHFGAGKDRRAR